MADGPNAFTYMRIFFVISISIYVIMFTLLTIVAFFNKDDISIPSYDIVINKINKLSIKPPDTVCNQQSYNKDTQNNESIIRELYNIFGNDFLLLSLQDKNKLITAYKNNPDIFYSKKPSQVDNNDDNYW